MASPSTPQDHKTKTDPRGLQRVKLGGKSRMLRFDGNAIIEACDATGMDNIEDILIAAGNLNFKTLRALTWAGLLHEDPDLELLDVGAMLGDGKNLTPFTEVLPACVTAVNAAIGVSAEETQQAMDEAEAEQARPTRRGGTGKKSAAPRPPRGSATPSSGG